MLIFFLEYKKKKEKQVCYVYNSEAKIDIICQVILYSHKEYIFGQITCSTWDYILTVSGFNNRDAHMF